MTLLFKILALAFILALAAMGARRMWARITTETDDQYFDRQWP